MLENSKLLYWHHFEWHKELWPKGFTKKRLDKAWVGLVDYKPLWDDVLIRHDGEKMSPIEMRDNHNKVYEHCMGNMAAMIREYMIKEKIIKRR